MSEWPAVKVFSPVCAVPEVDLPGAGLDPKKYSTKSGEKMKPTTRNTFDSKGAHTASGLRVYVPA
jgi:hypothetical protein